MSAQISAVASAASSAMEVPSDEDIALFEKLMSDGKRNYYCSQPQLALDCFVQLCEKLSKFYGQESEKCMEAYLFYGKTLLEIARLESGVFGQAIKETTEDGSDSELDEAPSAPAESEHQGNGKQPAEGANGKTPVLGSSAVAASGGSGNGSAGNGNGSAGIVPVEGENEAEDGDDDEEEDDITNMELAWEMFELVTVICKRALQNEVVSEVKKIKFALGEAKNGLAQVSLETEQYEEAVRDFTEALSIYKEVLDTPNDRVIAETHYNIALAFSFDKKFAEAIEQFKNAASVLRARVEDLEKKVKESEENGSKTEKAPTELVEWKKEINELNDLIQHEMMTRIDDAQESQRLLEQSIKTVKSAANEMFSAFGGTANAFDAGFDEADGFDAPAFKGEAVVQDCTDKIKSLKRKTEDDAASEVAVKK